MITDIKQQRSDQLMPGPISQKDSKQTTIPKPWIKTLFIRFLAIYGEKWTARMPSSDAYKIVECEWHDGLQGFTAAQIRRGLKKCTDPHGKHVTFPPTLGEFKLLCMLSKRDLAIPDTEEAYQEVYKNLREETGKEKVWTHELVFKAYASIGSFEFRTKPEREIRAQFERVYQKLVEKYLQQALGNEQAPKLACNNHGDYQDFAKAAGAISQKSHEKRNEVCGINLLDQT